MNRMTCCAVGVLLFTSGAFGWDSSIVYRDAATQRLVYKSDADGNRIVDFSHAGYQGGTATLPTVSVVRTVSPVAGDNTANIQNAINAVAALTPNASGHRGTVLLKKGTYPVSGIVYINASGIVLRGEGQGTADTVVVGTGTAQMKELGIIVVKLSTEGQIVASGTTQNITSEIVPVGSRTVEVENGSVYAVGDRLVIQHVATEAWLQAVRYGDTAGDEVPWTPGLGELTMKFEGTVTAISGNKIKLDTPIYNELNRSLSQTTVFRHTGAGVITECGVENMRVVSENTTTNSQNEDHRWDCVHFIGARNCWAKNVTAIGFAEGGFRFSKSIRSTVLSCSALDPVSQITGGRRYNFYIGSDCHDILFKGCTARKGRHDFVSNGTATSSGIVFTQSSASQSYASSENHRRWAEGILWDKITFTSPNTEYELGIGHNRGNYGTSHGWTGAGLVGWNVTARHVVVQQPPVGQNYAIACKGTVDNNGPWVFPLGFVEGTGQTNLSITSLYEAQLTERKTYGIGPDAPAKLRVTGTQSAALSWLDIALDETGYVVERSSNGGASYTVVKNLAANTTSYTDSAVGTGTYTYRVKSTNAAGSSAYCNPVSVTISSALTNGAAFVSQVVPSTMVAGQTTNVTVRMKNTGTATWSSADAQKLGSQNPQDTNTWGRQRVDLPAGVTVAPGQEYSFVFPITAPATAGTYNFQWKMVDDAGSNTGWFGPLTSNKQITVSVPNQAPYFTSDPFAMADAATGTAYSQSFSAKAVDPEGGTKTFSKVSGPMWLSVSSAGNATGTPGSVDVGTNSFMLQVTDNGGLSATATMKIKVNAATTTVPWVTNLTQAAAGTAITNAGLLVSGVSAEYHATIAAGKIFSQTPGGNTTVNLGSSVALACSLGPVPNLVVNGSFETNTNGWKLTGSAARSTSSAAGGGVASLRINTASSSATQYVAIVSGKTYDISVNANVATRTGGMVVFDTGDKYDGAGQGQFTFAATNGGWKVYSGSFTATNNFLTMRMFSDSAFAGTAYFDLIELKAR